MESFSARANTCKIPDKYTAYISTFFFTHQNQRFSGKKILYVFCRLIYFYTGVLPIVKTKKV
jgi:hypothetical protein